MKKIQNLLLASIAILIICIAGMYGCKQEKAQIIPDTEFLEYVAEYTSGPISAYSEILIRFNDNFVSGIVPGETISNDMLSFNPKIEGELMWKDAQTLVFTPSAPIKRDQEYKGSLSLDKVLKVEKHLEKFEFIFFAEIQNMKIDTESIKAYDEDQLEWNYMNGTVYTSDRAEEAEVEKTLKAFQDKNELEVTWTHNVAGKIHYFKIDSIKRVIETSEVLLQWDGSSIQSEMDQEFTKAITSINEFDVEGIRIIQEPNQVAIIEFSDPLQSDQTIENLVSVQGDIPCSFVLENNEVRIYPKTRLTGSVKIEIDGNLKNSLGYKLGESEFLDAMFEQILPNIEMVDVSKVILPSTDKMIMPFKAVNLEAVDVKVFRVYQKNIHSFLQVNSLQGKQELKRVGRVIRKKTVYLNPEGTIDLGVWNTFYLDISELIKTEPGALYRVEIDFRKSHSLYACEEGVDEYDDSAESPETEDWDAYDDEYSSQWDYEGDYYYDYYWNDYNYYRYNYEQRSNPCYGAYYKNKRPQGRNILASNLGLMAKAGNNGQVNCFVTDLLTAQPKAGVEVEVLDLQQKVLFKKTTNADGIVVTDKLEHKPFLIRAKDNDQHGYLRMTPGESNSVSRFQVSGSRSSKGMKGFIYGERGVWRPGDTLFLAFMLEDEERMLPKNHPVKFELQDPRGKIVTRETVKGNTDGIFRFTYAPSPESPTGNWTARVRVGASVFSKTLKIETIKPNRLKILLDFGGKEISSKTKSVGGLLKVNWLHGAIAKNMQAKVEMQIRASNTHFEGYEGFEFDDGLKEYSAHDMVVFDSQIDEKGEAEIEITNNSSNLAPGKLRASFNTKVFENGGGFSEDRFSIQYSPYEDYVGVSLPPYPKNRWGFYGGTDKEVTMVSLNEDGKPNKDRELEYQIFKVEWSWWWERNHSLSSYINRSGYSPIVEGKAKTDKTGMAFFNFKVPEKTWGRYVVRITDKKSGHSTSQRFYITYPGWRSNMAEGASEGASMLTFTSDKQSYETGEECELNIPSSENSRILISLENGSKVIKSWWVDGQKEQTTVRFDIEEDMAPNIYAHVSLVQPHNTVANDMPLRLYGLIPIMVEDKETIITPKIDMPDELRPESNFELKISEENGKAMTYTLAIVDEGLLDLTRFKTPNPHKHFYAKEALGVKTWDVFDDVMGAFAIDGEKLLAIGGDGEGADESGKQQVNRFKPMVRYIGPFNLKAGETKMHKINVPNYIGSVRTMVIAKDKSAYGNVEETTPVRKPLMVLATLPRVVGPAETVDLPVTVFAMKENIKNVDVKVTATENIEILGEANQLIKFAETGDKVCPFQLKIKEVVGPAKITVVCKSGNESASYDIEFMIRNPNPEVVEVIEAVINPGETWTKDFEVVGMPGTNTNKIEVSNFPSMNLDKRMNYLIGYPHGCVEQTTSKAFPQLYLDQVLDLTPQMKSDIQYYMNRAIGKLNSFQNAEGGFSYWAGQSNVSDWGSSYAGHFLLEAKKAGYSVPDGMIKQWIGYQQRIARSWRIQQEDENKYHYPTIYQSYRLYTLALANAPDLASMNRLREKDNLPVVVKWQLAASYALAGQKEVAKTMVDQLTTEIPDYEDGGYHFGSSLRDLSIVSQCLFLIGSDTQGAILVKEIAERLGSQRWYSTQSTAFAIMAIKDLSAKNKGGLLSWETTLNGKSEGNLKTNKTIHISELKVNETGTNKVKVTNTSEGLIYLNIYMRGQPAEDPRLAESNNVQLEIEYLDMDGRPIDETLLEQGTDFMAKVKVYHGGYRGYYQNIALTHVFPSGWEILNDRMREGTSSSYVSDYCTYQDIRDDRINSYFNVYRRNYKTFYVRLNATYSGRFYLPGVACEAMYDASINARTKGRWVNVLPSGQEEMVTK